MSEQKLLETKIDIANLDVGKAIRPTSKDFKMTTAKRKEFLTVLAGTMNYTKAAAAIGVTRQAVKHLENRDEKFAAAIQMVRDAYLDTIEEVSFTVACTPSREGFQDRKLQLQSHRRQTYGDKVQIDSTIKVNQTTAVIHLDAVLDNLPDLSLPQNTPNSLPERQENTKSIELSGAQPIDYTEVKS